MYKKPEHRISRQAREEASEWFLTFRESEADAATREAFYTWIRRSPENVQAYLRMTALWEDTGLLEKSELFDSQVILQRALQSPNVVELDRMPARAPVHVARKEVRRTAFRLAIAASAVILALGGLGWFWDQRNTYATDVGEQRTVALQDGTAVVLNARSRIRVRLSEKQRDIDLLEGQAIFRVSHDAARPFIVHSGSTNVRAVGTQFDVYRKADGTIVTVLEGTVAVRESGSLQDPGTDARPSAPGALSRGSVLVSAGEQITVSPHATTTPNRRISTSRPRGHRENWSSTKRRSAT